MALMIGRFGVGAVPADPTFSSTYPDNSLIGQNFSYIRQGVIKGTRIDSDLSWYPGAAGFFFNNLYWFVGPSYSRDVLYSDDLETWTTITPLSYITGYMGYTIYDNRMWVFGGRASDCDGDHSAVERSDTTGMNWEHVGFLPDYYSELGACTYDNLMWIMGGVQCFYGIKTRRNDVWYSSNGTTWTQATANAAWADRNGHSVIVFNGKMWVIGGETTLVESPESSLPLNDVWYSVNGSTWTQATGNAAWKGRKGHSSFIFEDKIFIASGQDGDNLLSDMWFSEDGSNWYRVYDNTGFYDTTKGENVDILESSYYPTINNGTNVAFLSSKYIYKMEDILYAYSKEVNYW